LTYFCRILYTTKKFLNYLHLRFPQKELKKGATTFSITTLSITTFSITTLSVKDLFATLSIVTFSINDTQHNSTLSIIMLNVAFECHYAECRYAKCRYTECRYDECRGALEKGIFEHKRPLGSFHSLSFMLNEWKRCKFVLKSELIFHSLNQYFLKS
jgi:hypothetical protein